jgi:hypothetical protein
MKDSVEGAYFFAWGQFRRQLRGLGVPSKECDAKRHEIHVDALGYDKSHTKFTNRETNLVIKKFRELSGAIRTTDYERGCRIYVIRQICASMGKGESYAQGIADQMDGEGRLLSGPVRRAPGQTKGEHDMKLWELELTRGPVVRRLLSELKPEELDKVIVALRKYEELGVVAEPEPASEHVLASPNVRTSNTTRGSDLDAQRVGDLVEGDPF